MKKIILAMFLLVGSLSIYGQQELENFEHVGSVGSAEVGVDFKTATIAKGVTNFWVLLWNDAENYTTYEYKADCLSKKYTVLQMRDVTGSRRTEKKIKDPVEKEAPENSPIDYIITMVCVGKAKASEPKLQS